MHPRFAAMAAMLSDRMGFNKAFELLQRPYHSLTLGNKSRYYGRKGKQYRDKIANPKVRAAWALPVGDIEGRAKALEGNRNVYKESK